MRRGRRGSRSGARVEDFDETAGGKVAVRIDPAGQELEQPALREASADQVLAQAGEVTGHDEVASRQHIGHDRRDRTGQEVGDGDRVGLGRVGEEAQDGA